MSDFLLSEGVREQIRSILERTNDIERENVDDAISHIDLTLDTALILEKSGNPTESKAELAALHQSIVKLRGKIHALSLDSKLALNGYFNEGDAEQSDADQIAEFPRPRGSKFAKFLINAEAMVIAVSESFSEIDVPRGRRVHFRARSIALDLYDSLVEVGIKVTTSDKGPFMAILQVALSELFHTRQEASYRRHGLWACNVRNKKLEVNWASMKVDTQK